MLNRLLLLLPFIPMLVHGQALVIQRQGGKRIDTLRVGDRIAFETKHEHAMGFLGVVPRIRRTYANGRGKDGNYGWLIIQNDSTILIDPGLQKMTQWRFRKELAVKYVWKDSVRKQKKVLKYSQTRPSQMFTDAGYWAIQAIDSHRIHLQYPYGRDREAQSNFQLVALDDIHRIVYDKRWRKDRTGFVAPLILLFPITIPILLYQDSRLAKWYRIVAVLPKG